MSDEDIPVLSDVVSRKSPEELREEQIDEICDLLNAEARVLIDKLLAEAFREAEDLLRLRLNDRISDELPGLIEKILQEKLNDAADD